MSAEENKKTVEVFLEKISGGNAKDILAMLSDDATWWIAGKPEDFPIAGTKTKAEFAAILEDLPQLFPDGMKMRLTALTAEGDRVAAEGSSYAETASGAVYNNDFHWLLVLRNSQIVQVKEYMDTIHAKKIFLG